MEVQFTEKKLISLFVEIDDLLLSFYSYQQKHNLLSSKKPTRVPVLSCSEICTIIVSYHLSGYKCFEYYYKEMVLKALTSYFPKAPSYECFLSYIPRCIDVLYLWLLYSCSKSQETGLYFVDSKKIQVCHLRREKSNKIFKEYARKGKSSTGWLYGLKLHLIINNLGEIMSFDLTSGNIADNNHNLLQKLLGQLKGICVGDKGYFSTLFAFFYENGLHLLTKAKKNMKNKVSTSKHQKLINKRGIIESTFDILTSICDIEHSRHRNPISAFTNVFAGLIAYQSLESKPTVFFPSIQQKFKKIVAL